MKLYKLTNKDGFTRRGSTNETKWGKNVPTRQPAAVACVQAVLYTLTNTR